jgi:hypothetical protein
LPGSTLTRRGGLQRHLSELELKISLSDVSIVNMQPEGCQYTGEVSRGLALQGNPLQLRVHSGHSLRRQSLRSMSVSARRSSRPEVHVSRSEYILAFISVSTCRMVELPVRFQSEGPPGSTRTRNMSDESAALLSDTWEASVLGELLKVG